MSDMGFGGFKKHPKFLFASLLFVCLCQLSFLFRYSNSLLRWTCSFEEFGYLKFWGFHLLQDLNFERTDRRILISKNVEWKLPSREKFMWYATHGGFSNQVIGLRWALRVASILNRTLVIPPKLPHFSSISIGNCAKNPTPPWLFRKKAWNAYISSLQEPVYLSMADVLDLSRIPPAVVKTIDFRHFIARFCGCDIGNACHGPRCRALSKPASKKRQSKCMRRCGSRLGGRSEPESAPFLKENLLYLVNSTCGSTVWTLRQYSSIQELGKAAGPNDPNLSPFAQFAARGTRHWPAPRCLSHLLGQGTAAGQAKVMAFPSFFHPRIGDFDVPPVSQETAVLRRHTQSVHFVPPIVAMAQAFIANELNGSHDFVCLHIRGSDSFFRQRLEKTMRKQRKELLSLHATHKSQRDSEGKLSLFLMTDVANESLPFVTSLGALGFSVRSLLPWEKAVGEMAGKSLAMELGLHTNRVPFPEASGKLLTQQTLPSPLQEVMDFRLYVEQSICSWAKLGFVGTHKSTASGIVNNLRQSQQSS